MHWPLTIISIILLLSNSVTFLIIRTVNFFMNILLLKMMSCWDTIWHKFWNFCAPNRCNRFSRSSIFMARLQKIVEGVGEGRERSWLCLLFRMSRASFRPIEFDHLCSLLFCNRTGMFFLANEARTLKDPFMSVFSTKVSVSVQRNISRSYNTLQIMQLYFRSMVFEFLPFLHSLKVWNILYHSSNF